MIAIFKVRLSENWLRSGRRLSTFGVITEHIPFGKRGDTFNELFTGLALKSYANVIIIAVRPLLCGILGYKIRKFTVL